MEHRGLGDYALALRADGYDLGGVLVRLISGSLSIQGELRSLILRELAATDGDLSEDSPPLSLFGG